MGSAEVTPPYSPKLKPHSYPINNHGESLSLVGLGKFPRRDDINNILITGGAGFIGGWVTRHLAVQYPEYNIVCFDKLDVVASLSNVDCLQSLPNFTFVKGDITSMKDVSQVLKEHNIDAVLHFAASSHVQNSFDQSASFTHNNVVGTHVLLECVRHHGKVTRFLHVSTDEVYGETNGDFLDESHQFLPTNPYSASKAAAEMYVYAYSKSFNIPSIIVRSNNVYGPCQYPEKPLTIQGSGLNSRRYLYGADAADAFDTVLHKGELGEAYNVGSAFEITNFEVAVRMLKLFGHSASTDFHRHLRWIDDRPFNDFDYRVNGDKLQTLGWRQRVSFETGLTASVEWYRRNMHTWWPSETKNEELVLEQATIKISGAIVSIVEASPMTA